MLSHDEMYSWACLFLTFPFAMQKIVIRKELSKFVWSSKHKINCINPGKGRLSHKVCISDKAIGVPALAKGLISEELQTVCQTLETQGVSSRNSTGGGKHTLECSDEPKPTFFSCNTSSSTSVQSYFLIYRLCAPPPWKICWHHFKN